MTDQENYSLPTIVHDMLAVLKNFETDESAQHGLAYRADPTDVFIVTPPKCGTTWMQQIVHGLRTRGSMDFDEISSVVPWIELALDMGIDIYAPQAARPHAFKTHATLAESPKGGRYIVILRDPKDALWSHYKFFEGFFFEKGSIDIQTFAREYFFVRKSIIKHIHALWDRRMDKDVLPLCFEDMKSDLPNTVERVANFIGIPLDEELREIVIRQSDIKFMLAHNNQFDEHPLRKIRQHAWKVPFSTTASKLRSEQVGESKIGVSDEIKEELDDLWHREVTAKLGLNSYDDLRKALAM
jgi:hypothetical protein